MYLKIKDLVPGMVVAGSRGPVTIAGLRKKVNTPKGLVYHWSVNSGYAKTLSGLGERRVSVHAVPVSWDEEQATISTEGKL